jgi:hypothetical protein
MSNELVTPPGGGYDDGFAPTNRSARGGTDFLRWNVENDWTDRDGCKAPSPMLAVRVDDFLRMWKTDIPTDITDKPLPDPDTLNAAIPKDQWEEGLDGKLRAPWSHHVAVYLVNLETAQKYVYAAATVGAHIAYEALKEAVITMRMLRGTRCMPIVNLARRPMKTKFKMSERPHFEIIGWKTPGEDANAIPAQPTAPQLPGPAAAAETPAPTPDPISSGPQPKPQRRAKPPVKATLDAMGEVKPATSAEILDDSIPW